MMNALAYFESQLSQDERRILNSFQTTADIQTFLDGVPYPAGDTNRSPLQVLRERQAHCLDGGLFAAAALRRLGYPPLILDLQPDPGVDDDHVLGLFKIDGCWGAVAKSNYNGLRYREAIYRTLRELVISYFEDYFNVQGEKTLRYYTRPINMGRFDSLGWMWTRAGVDAVEQYLKTAKLNPIITPAQAARLAPVEKLSYQAGMIGLNMAGVYQPKSKTKRAQKIL